MKFETWQGFAAGLLSIFLFDNFWPAMGFAVSLAVLGGIALRAMFPNLETEAEE